MFAGVSADHDTRLEKSHVGGLSNEALKVVARALQLDEAELAHLQDLILQVATRPAATPARSKPAP